MPVRHLARALVAGALLLATTSIVAAQGTGSTLHVTIQDETEAALLHATAILVDGAGIEHRAAADDSGVATLTGLEPGVYQLRVEAEAFRPYVADVTIRRGNNQTRVRLAVALAEAIVVNEEDAQARRDNGFTTTLSAEEIESLSDDPDEMAEQLAQMAGPDAQIFVDGFQGGRLPPKDQIQQVRFHSNSFSAEYHDAGMVRVEVITKPGLGGWRGRFNMGFRDESLNARNAFAPEQGPEQQKRFMFDFRGPLVAGKTSLSIAVDGNSSYDARTVVAFTPAATINEQIRRPVDGLNATVRVEHALSPTSAIRTEYLRRSSDRRNLGVGDFDLFERAYETRSVTDTLRVRNTRTIGRKAFSELRVELSQSETTDDPASLEPTVRVLEAFAGGGAGRLGSRQGRQLEIAQNVDFTIRKHAFRAGALFETGWWDSTQQTNTNGTFTFSSLADYLAGVPSTYTRRVGDPLVSYSQVQAGWYLQDDFRLRKNLSVSLGVRQEIQTHVGDAWNVAPRGAFTWTVGKTNVRGGWGIFYEWFEPTAYEQTVRLDGTHQIEEVILAPSFPDATIATGTRLPASMIRAADDLAQPTIRQASIGFERDVTSWLGIRTDYLFMRGSSTLRSVNVNAPGPDGLRPDPLVGNVSEIQSAGRSAQDRLTIGLRLRAPSRRMFGNVRYQLGSIRNHADSPLALPADSHNPDADWGPAARDIRHRVFLMLNTPVAFGVRAGLNVQGSSAPPYTITTGLDDNGDTVFNDRPAGVGRNSARGASQWNVTLRLTRSFALGDIAGEVGGAPPPPPAGGAQRGPGGGAGEGGGPQMVVMQASNARYRLDLYVQAFNLLNYTNLNAFVGNQLSPAFGRATSAASARRIELGASLSF